MQGQIMQAIIKKLAAISIAAGCSIGPPIPTLLDVPTCVLEDLLDDLEETDTALQGQERSRVASLLTRDPRPEVRARAAESLALLPQVEGERLFTQLVHDAHPDVRRSAGNGLADLLAQLPPLARSEWVARWAVSNDDDERLAIARALASPAPIVGSDAAIEHLCHDPRRLVRRAASAALATRNRDGDRAMRAVATRLVSSPDRVVRRAARKALADSA